VRIQAIVSDSRSHLVGFSPSAFAHKRQIVFRLLIRFPFPHSFTLNSTLQHRHHCLLCGYHIEMDRYFVPTLINIIYTVEPILQWVSHSCHKKGGLDPPIISESVAPRQYFFWEDKVFMWLVSRCHPSTESFIQENVLGVEGFELRIFCCSDLL